MSSRIRNKRKAASSSKPLKAAKKLKSATAKWKPIKAGDDLATRAARPDFELHGLCDPDPDWEVQPTYEEILKRRVLKTDSGEWLKVEVHPDRLCIPGAFSAPAQNADEDIGHAQLQLGYVRAVQPSAELTASIRENGFSEGQPAFMAVGISRSDPRVAGAIHENDMDKLYKYLVTPEHIKNGPAKHICVDGANRHNICSSPEQPKDKKSMWMYALDPRTSVKERMIIASKQNILTHSIEHQEDVGR